MTGSHASLIEPYKLIKLEKNTTLEQAFGEYDPKDQKCKVKDSHHFPILYGKHKSQFVHGVPINGVVNKDNKLYNIITFNEERDMFRLFASIFRVINGQRKTQFETVCVVMLPEYKEEKKWHKKIYEIDDRYIDFAFLPNDDNSGILTMYKFNSLRKGPLRFQDTFNLIAQQLKPIKITTFAFYENFRERYKDFKDKIPDFDNYKELKYQVELDDNGIWNLKLINNGVSIQNKMLEDLFSEALIHNNYYDYLLKSGRYENLQFIENHIETGYDMLRYYTNVPLYVLAEDSGDDVWKEWAKENKPKDLE